MIHSDRTSYNRAMTRRIGIYPGTFDPVHAGHIAFARETMRLCDLDKVYFLPEPKPPKKPNATDIMTRTADLRKALSNIDGLEVFQPGSEQYSIADTLPRLTHAFRDTEFTMMVGSDAFRSLIDWQDIDILLQGHGFAVGLRGDDTEQDMKKSAKKFQEKMNLKLNYKIIHNPDTKNISSTRIRAERDR